MAVAVPESHIFIDVPVSFLEFNVPGQHLTKLGFVVGALLLVPGLHKSAATGLVRPVTCFAVTAVLFLGPGPELVVVVFCVFHLRTCRLSALRSLVIGASEAFHSQKVTCQFGES